MITSKQYIYKYFEINKYTIEVLVNNALHFSNPINFNDPFDCSFNLDLVPNSDADKSLHIKFNLKEDQQELFESGFKDNISKECGAVFNKKLLSMINITCFSENVDNFLLWSHYADSHKGLCLKFDWKIHEEYFQGNKVVYKNKLPTIKYSSDDGFRKEINRITTTKLKCWEYENEVRSIVENGNSDRKNPSFNPQTLVSVIFGSKTSHEDILLIKNIIDLHKGYKDVQLCQAKLNQNSGKIEINRLQ